LTSVNVNLLDCLVVSTSADRDRIGNGFAMLSFHCSLYFVMGNAPELVLMSNF